MDLDIAWLFNDFYFLEEEQSEFLHSLLRW